jgi:hypothetical protein
MTRSGVLESFDVLFAMGRVTANWLVAVSVMIGFCASGWAESVDAGKTEYLSSCADCHGPDGKGTGPLASKLKTKPADLTIIAKKNNGVFPLAWISTERILPNLNLMAEVRFWILFRSTIKRFRYSIWCSDDSIARRFFARAMGDLADFRPRPAQMTPEI